MSHNINKDQFGEGLFQRQMAYSESGGKQLVCAVSPFEKPRKQVWFEVIISKKGHSNKEVTRYYSIDEAIAAYNKVRE